MPNTEIKKNWIPTGEELDQRFKAHLEEYDKALRAYLAGELEPVKFRRKRLALGIYYQNPEVSYMFRIKIAAGLIDYDMAMALASVGDKYARGLPHVSTRQNIQYHYIPITYSTEIFKELWGVGIESIGASGDGARNVTCDQFAGVDPEEPFDGTPYALLINAFYRFHDLNLKLPRKYKIAVSGPRDRAQVGINCLGFLTTQRDGEDGFEVYVGGGLGSRPFAAALANQYIPKNDVLIAADAAIRLFHDHGDRENRKKARMKFIVQRLGKAKFQALWDEYYAASEAQYGDVLRAQAEEWLSTQWTAPQPVLAADAVRDAEVDAAGFEKWKRQNTFVQKQAGYRAVTVKLPLGDLSTAQFRMLAELAKEVGNGVQRATDLQKLVLQSIPEGVLPYVYEKLVAWNLAEAGAGLISDAVVCSGLDYCTLAVAKSRSFGNDVRDLLASSGFDEEQMGLFNFQISGCPNACGQHNAADIGATGMMVTDAQGIERPHFTFFVGGRCQGDRSLIAQRIRGRFPAAKAPNVVADLAKDYLNNRNETEDYADYVERIGLDHLYGIATPYLHA